MTNIQEQNETTREAEMRIRKCRESRLRTLDLSDIGLNTLPVEIKKLKYLEVLKLNENAITKLPDIFGELGNLEYLDLSYNNISALPQSIGSLNYLKTLNIRCNQLKSIPDFIGKLSLLRTFDVSYNRLLELPEVINNLANLGHCNIKGNNIRILPEKISGMLRQKNISLLGHIQQIIELTGQDGISDNLLLIARQHINYISQKLDISPVQSVLFAHIVSSFDHSPVGIQEIARSLHCNKIKLMQHSIDFDELEGKKLIRVFKKPHGRWPTSDIAEYYISKEVLVSLMKDEKFVPENQSNLSITELFDRIHSLFEQRVGDQEISYDELAGAIFELLNDNMQLSFVKQIYGYKLPNDDLMLLLRFCHLFINLDHDELEFNEIMTMYDHHSKFNSHKRNFRAGEHILMTRGFVEFVNSGGFGNRDSFKLTDMVKNNLLAELRIKTPCTGKEIIRASTIQVKQMFYNEAEKAQIQRLSSLLNESSYKEVRSRLADTGMRTGFACLFSGPPGTGKTETVYQLAKKTGRDIVAVDISQSKSMWFGESEKIIKKIFSRYRDYAEEAEVTPILFFNEADAIFGKRKDLPTSAVAQTENAIQNIILQELEDLKGILIATTNMTENLDKAFERRFLYKIEFKKPDFAIRQSLWKSMIPEISGEDVRELAVRFDFSGGQIENIARKRTVDFVLSGLEPDLAKLIMFCEEELINTHKPKIIGFAA